LLGLIRLAGGQEVERATRLASGELNRRVGWGDGQFSLGDRGHEDRAQLAKLRNELSDVVPMALDGLIEQAGGFSLELLLPVAGVEETPLGAVDDPQIGHAAILSRRRESSVWSGMLIGLDGYPEWLSRNGGRQPRGRSQYPANATAAVVAVDA